MKGGRRDTELCSWAVCTSNILEERTADVPSASEVLRPAPNGPVVKEGWLGHSLRRRKKGQNLIPSLKHLSRVMTPAGLVGLRAAVALDLVLDCHLLR